MKATRNSPPPPAVEPPSPRPDVFRTKNDGNSPSSPNYHVTSSRIGSSCCTNACCNDFAVGFSFPTDSTVHREHEEFGCACCRDHEEHEKHMSDGVVVSDGVSLSDSKWEPGEEIELHVDKDIASEEAEANSLSVPPFPYCTWNLRVDLSAGVLASGHANDQVLRKDSVREPSESPLVKTDDELRAVEYYSTLQYVLYEAGLPETRDRTKKPRHIPGGSDSVCIVVLASPADCASMLLEGGIQSPGNMLLVLSLTWLSKLPSEHGEGLFSLLVHKAVTFKDGGRSYLDVFKPPRRATYFVNHFARSISSFRQRQQIDELETGLECPMSSSHRLSRLIDNKLWTRIKLAECGIGYPETLAFAYRSSAIYETKLHTIFIVHLLTKEGVEMVVHDEVERFVALPVLESNDKIVVKPSGVTWRGAHCLSFHARTDVDSITSAVIALLDQIEEENVILVEAYYSTTFPGLTCDVEHSGTDHHALRLHSTVCRSPDNMPVMTKLVTSIGKDEQPVTVTNAVPQCFDSALNSFGLQDENERQHLYDVIREGSENLLKAVIDYESGLSCDEKGGIEAQTDIIEIDFVLSDVNNVTTPIAIAVSGLDGASLSQMYEFMNTETRGDAFRPVIRTMIARSQRFFIHGKTVLIIGSGAGSLGRKLMANATDEYGIKMVLIDSVQPDCGEEHTFIEYNFSDHSQDDSHAVAISSLIQDRSLRIDGCLTFDGKCLALVAAVCQCLNLTGPPLSATKTIMLRSSMMECLMAQTSTLPHEPRVCLYTTPTYRINSKKDIAGASIKMSYPFVIKREMSPSMATVIADAPTAYATFDMLCENSGTEEDRLCSDSKPNSLGIIMMPYLPGTEHTIVVVLYHRCLIASYVIDVAQGYTGGAVAALPSFLPSDRVAQLRIAARQCCVGINLTDGIFHVRLRMSAAGPKLIAIDQGEIADFFIHDWIRVAYGVDLLLARLMIHCGVRPVLPTPRPGRRPVFMVGVNVPSTIRPEKFRGLAEVLEIHGAVRINRLHRDGEDSDIYFDSSGHGIWCNIAVADADHETAENRLIEYTTLLGITSEHFDMAMLLRRMHRGDGVDDVLVQA